MLEGPGGQLPLEPHPEAGTSRSCLPGLATGGAGRGHLSPWPVKAGRATWLCPEQMNHGSWETRWQETRGSLLLPGRHLQLVWPGVGWQEDVLGR